MPFDNDELAKRTAGTPLSDAELKQRRDAAKARWGATVAAGAASAAVAGSVVAEKLRRQRKADTTVVREALQPVRAVRVVNNKRVARLARKLATVQENLRPSDGPVFVQQAIKTLRSKLNRDTAVWNHAFAYGAQPVTINGSGDAHGPITEHLSPDQSIKPLFEPVGSGRATLEDLRTKGRAARNVRVKAREAHAVAGYTKQVRGKRVAVWSGSAYEKLAYLKEKAGQPAPTRPAKATPARATPSTTVVHEPSAELGFLGVPEAEASTRRKSPKTKKAALGPNEMQQWKDIIDEHWHDHLAGSPNAERAHPDHIAAALENVHSLDDLERQLNSVQREYRRGYREHHLLPSFTTVAPLKDVTIAPTMRAAEETRRKIKAYPDTAQRKNLSTYLIGHTNSRAREVSRQERIGALSRLAEARRIALQRSHAPLSRLSVWTLPRRVAAIGAAAGVAGLTAAAIAHRMTAPPLQKAAPRKPRRATPVETVAPTQAAADTAETEIAKRLAAMFGRWTNGVEDKLAGPSATTLHTDMTADLTRALAPVDEAVRAGAAQPIESDGPGRVVALSLLGRNPAVTSYLDSYRTDRIVALADEQRDAIKEQLIQAAQEGASPQEMARRIRETIGLTAFQMQHVVNYRDELEQLKPEALGRALRDQRFDGPIRRAVESGEVLSADAINRYVDAYHRRYLAYRAMTIARTEGVGGANNGQAATAIAAEQQNPGMTLEKTWIARQDSKTRHDHYELHGKVVVGLDTPFECDSGDTIRWPHDPQAPARQVINCRCAWATRLVPIDRVGTESPDSEQPENTE